MNALRSKKLAVCFGFFLLSTFVFAQDNSPYSRYGLGDFVPNTHIINRAMGGVSAAFNNSLSINFNNPASYSAFLTYMEERTKKSLYGRVLFDVGLNFDDHSLKEKNSTQKFSSSNAIFSYMQVGVPVKNNWGLNFGLRQISRIGYDLFRSERLFDPISGNMIDSVLTEFKGDGGSSLASAGTGFSILDKSIGDPKDNRRQSLSLGLNFGYLFGKKEYSTKRIFVNDTVNYKSSSHSTKTGFGNVFFNFGIQYRVDLQNNFQLNLGAYGNMKQTLNGNQDIVRETFVPSTNGDIRLDSVYEQSGIKGKITYPANYTIGFFLAKKPDEKNKKIGTWLLGADFIQTQWSQYRFYNAIDSVKNNWELRIGGEIRPQPKSNYFSNVSYRGGFFVGTDYILVGNKLPLFGASFGLGLPLANYNRLAQGQASIINLSLEYIKRGNNSNLLKDNIFRLSIGLSFSDLWFAKRRYAD
jgi:hypothetical protein